MKNVQIRNVPDETHAVLRRRAAEAGMSLQEYLLGLVTDISARPSVEDVLRRAGSRSGGRLSMKQAAELVREDRDGR
jgi:antitoxin FitA